MILFHVEVKFESKLDIPYLKAVKYQEYLDPGIFHLIIFNAFKCKIFADFQNFKFAKFFHLIRGV